MANIDMVGFPPTEERTRTFAPTTYRSDSHAILEDTIDPPAVGTDNLIAGSPPVSSLSVSFSIVTPEPLAAHCVSSVAWASGTNDSSLSTAMLSVTLVIRSLISEDDLGASVNTT